MEEAGAEKPLSLPGLFRRAKAYANPKDGIGNGDGLKDSKGHCRVVSSGSFTAFRMTARTCKSKSKKQKEKAKAKACGRRRIYFPTHRKVRDGWGTRRFVLGEEEQPAGAVK
jgi:hypothetical protein